MAGLAHSKNIEILLKGLFSIFMIGIDVLVCMEMVIDGGKERVIGGDIHDDIHVIASGI